MKWDSGDAFGSLLMSSGPGLEAVRLEVEKVALPCPWGEFSSYWSYRNLRASVRAVQPVTTSKGPSILVLTASDLLVSPSPQTPLLRISDKQPKAHSAGSLEHTGARGATSLPKDPSLPLPKRKDSRASARTVESILDINRFSFLLDPPNTCG